MDHEGETRVCLFLARIDDANLGGGEKGEAVGGGTAGEAWLLVSLDMKYVKLCRSRHHSWKIEPVVGIREVYPAIEVSPQPDGGRRHYIAGTPS